MKIAVIAFAAGCLLQSGLQAAEEPAAKAASGTASPIATGDTDLRSLLRDVGQRLHKKFVWDPHLQAAVELGSLQRQELTYPQLLAILQLNGYVAIERDGLVEVVPNADARQAPTPVVSADNIKGLDDELVTVVVTLRTSARHRSSPFCARCCPNTPILLRSQIATRSS